MTEASHENAEAARDRPLPVLIIDDDDSVRSMIPRELGRRGIGPTTAKDGEEGLKLLDQGQFPVVLCDINMPGMSGLDVLRRVKERDGDLTEVIMLTGQATIEKAVEAMKAGAFTFLEKTTKVAELAAVLKSAGEKAALRRENLLLKRDLEDAKDRRPEGALVGESPAWKKVLKIVEKVGPTGSTVLILGKSGTGKEGIARAVHRHSPRANRPFVAVNCAAVTATLLEAELFGHEQGAFTGAQKRRRGLFELASGGTLFLDEIGETSPDFQTKLLRVLETGEFRRVGGESASTLSTLRADVRVIAATNRDLKKEIEKGRFREDLYYRLNVLQTDLPSLSERKGDVTLLARHFLAIQRESKAKDFSPDALELLERYPWPGNVRELKNIVERMAILAEGETIVPDDLPGDVRARAEATEPPPAPGEEQEPKPATPEQIPSLAEIEKRHILKVLDQLSGNKVRSARALGITPATLYNKLKVYKSQETHPEASS
jgi:DNA-binding NtrC family response regulator